MANETSPPIPDEGRNVNLTLVRMYIYSAGLLLVCTGLAKIISATGQARILDLHDPIFLISFKFVFWIVGTAELLVACACIFGRQPAMQLKLVGWLAVSFLLYRVGLLWVGYHHPCPCMGNLMDALHVNAHTVEIGMRWILGYLLIGSYGMLLFFRERVGFRCGPPA